MPSRSIRLLLASLLVVHFLPSGLFGQAPTLTPVARIAPPGAAHDFAFRFDAEGGILAAGTPSTKETHIFVRGAGYTWNLTAVVPPESNPPSSAGSSVVVSQGRVGVASSRGVDLYFPDGSRDSWIISRNSKVALEGDDFVGWQSYNHVSNVRPHYQLSQDDWEYGAALEYDTWSLLGLDFDADRLALLSATLYSSSHDAYVAERDPVTGEFAPSAHLVPSVPDVRLRSIAISGDTAVVGAPSLAVGVEAGWGAIFVFDYDAANGQWSQVQMLMEPNGGKDHLFGYSVALRGGLLLTSAPREPSGGRGYLFERNSTTGQFVEKALLLDPLANGNRGLGDQLALGDDVAFLNASADDSVLAFALHPAPATVLELDPWPTCVSTPSLEVTGRTSGGSSVARLYGDQPGTTAEILCESCGVDPTFSWTATDLAACDNRFTVGLLDEHDREASFSSTVRFDDTPPELSAYHCRDRSFLVPAGGSVEITPPGSIENCDRPPLGIATCDNPGPFTAGVTTVTCSESDSCGNTASCTFTVTVVEETAGPVPEVSLVAPACTAEPLVTVTGDVLADEEVTRIAASVDGGPEADICLGCGFDPAFSFDASLAACDNSIRVTAQDAGGEVGETTTIVRFDGEGPVFTCPDNIYANVPHASATKAEVYFETPSAADACDGSLAPDCYRWDDDFVSPGEEDFYRLGRDGWSCSRRDSCNNRGFCSFAITVLPFGAAPPAEGCRFYEFRDNELLEYPTPGVIRASIGDVSFFEDISEFTGANVEVGSAPLSPTADHGGFLYREVTGDVRVETPLPEVDGTADPAAAAGLMMRWGFDEQARRALVALRPDDPAGPVIEFRVRTDYGLADLEVATRIPAVGVTDLALELEGDRVTAQYSLDGGHTWITPSGGLGGAATVAGGSPGLGTAQAGIFVSDPSPFGPHFVFPYMELCPILGVDPGPVDPPVSDFGCRDDDFDDEILADRWTFTGLGNANQLAVGEVGGRVEITADGATAFAGADNAGYLYQTLRGDFRVEVTVDGTDMITGGVFRKAGLMVRASLDPWSPRLLAQLVPFWNGSAGESHLQFVARPSQGALGNVAVATDVVGTAKTVRLAIERRGDVFEVQFSHDGGTTWTTPGGGLGGSVTLALPDTVLVGLDVVSNDISTTSTVAFDDFTLCPICEVDDFEDGELDAPWTLDGFGNASLVSGDESAGVFALTANGSTAFAGADNAGYLYRSVEGDFRAEITVDGTPMTAGGAFRKAGLMVRTSLDPWSPRLLAQLVPYWNNSPGDSRLQFVAREIQNGPGNVGVASDVAGVPKVVRLAVERAGNVFSVEYSTDGGLTWTRPSGYAGGSIALDLPDTVLLGLDVVSNNVVVTSTSEFDDFELCLASP